MSARLAVATPPVQYPQCWMWSEPTQSGWSDKNFIPMARVVEGCTTTGDETPEGLANDLADKVARLIGAGLLPLTGTRLCVNIQNFGRPENSQALDSLFVAEDDVDVNTNDDPLNDPDWPSPLASEQKPKLQPWMTQGRINCKQWMQRFIARYQYRSQQNTVLPPWDRFHLDHESGITQLGTGNWPFLLKAMVMENDSPIIDSQTNQVYNRWNYTKVPGFNLTMAQLWAGTPASWRQNQDPNSSFWNLDLKNVLSVGADDGFQTVGPTNHNRDIFLWYQSICQRATDAALNECAYATIIGTIVA